MRPYLHHPPLHLIPPAPNLEKDAFAIMLMDKVSRKHHRNIFFMLTCVVRIKCFLFLFLVLLAFYLSIIPLKIKPNSPRRLDRRCLLSFRPPRCRAVYVVTIVWGHSVRDDEDSIDEGMNVEEKAWLKVW